MGWNPCCVGQCVHQKKYYNSAKRKRVSTLGKNPDDLLHSNFKFSQNKKEISHFLLCPGWLDVKFSSLLTIWVRFMVI